MLFYTESGHIFSGIFSYPYPYTTVNQKYSNMSLHFLFFFLFSSTSNILHPAEQTTWSKCISEALRGKAELKEAFPSLSAFVIWYPRRPRWRENDFLLPRVEKERPMIAIFSCIWHEHWKRNALNSIVQTCKDHSTRKIRWSVLYRHCSSLCILIMVDWRSRNRREDNLNPFCLLVQVMARSFFTLTFKSVDEILWCYHSNETSSTVLSRDTIYIQYCIFVSISWKEIASNFWSFSFRHC